MASTSTLSIRLILVSQPESVPNKSKLPENCLIVVDAKGLLVGRDRPKFSSTPRLRLVDLAVSRLHCQLYLEPGHQTMTRNSNFVFDNVPEDDELAVWCPDKYYIIDHGSTHGTFLNGFRINLPKFVLFNIKHRIIQEFSKPQALGHLDNLRIGNHEFVIHIHSEWGCNDCLMSDHVVVNTDVNAEFVQRRFEAEKLKREQENKIWYKNITRLNEELPNQRKKGRLEKERRLENQRMKEYYFGKKKTRTG
ncbi:hypothetical protein HK096_004871 [Nowakowskiella sp. JEL0078]|nr:hypothetical protein HK096_004871 [Nowakowskiella sp. JEL0078]